MNAATRDHEAPAPAPVASKVEGAVVGEELTSIRMVVDFPAPLGPKKPVTHHGRARKLTWSTAVDEP